VGTLVNLAVNLLSTTALASMLFQLYRKFGSRGSFDAARQDLQAAAARDPRFRLTRRRLAVLAVVGGVLAVAVGAVAIRSVNLEDRCQV
ncbi:MAG: hypothetical protein GTO03_18550, partial [Planctomycetales bacterium]|nr:hypothetical protein [Planctomycetales bacterium]